jgi:hypothetical protein
MGATISAVVRKARRTTAEIGRVGRIGTEGIAMTVPETTRKRETTDLARTAVSDIAHGVILAKAAW